jgi:biopolymer transport protein ExbD
MANSTANTNPNPQPTLRRRRKAPNFEASPDLTPMIDCTFQLIIFFMLTAQMASQQAKLILPGPTESQAVKPSEGSTRYDGLVINIPNAFEDKATGRTDSPQTAGRPTHILVAGLPPMTVSNHGLIQRVIRDRMATARHNGISTDRYFVELRVDKDIHWRYVQPLMQIASDAGISKIVFTARTTTTQ